MAKLKLEERPTQIHREYIRRYPEEYTPAQKELLQFMDDYKLDRRRLASLTGYSITTVHAWFFRPKSTGYRKINPRKLSMIKAQVRDKLLYQTAASKGKAHG